MQILFQTYRDRLALAYVPGIARFMGNGIVANRRYLTSHITTHLKSILCEEGLVPVIVESSEFGKSGGSLFCMKAFLP